MYIYDWYHSNVSDILYIHEHRLQYTWRIPLAFYLPLLIPLCSPLYPLLLTWNPPSCDTICPPGSQVACKLTSPVPTLSPKPSPLQIPRTPITRASLRRPQEESGVFCPEHKLYDVSNFSPVSLNYTTFASFRFVLIYFVSRKDRFAKPKISRNGLFF